MKGRDLSDSEDVPSLKKSIELFKQAVELDPKFASAYAEIANSTFLLVVYDNKPFEDGFDESMAWVDKALAIYPNNARAYGTRGFLYGSGLRKASKDDEEKAQSYCEKSSELNPKDHRVIHHFSNIDAGL